MNMLNALQTTPAAADAGAKRSPEPKSRDDAVDDTGFAKLMQQQTQLRQASQRQLAQRQAEQRLPAAAPQAAGVGKAQEADQDLAETRDAGRRSKIAETEPAAASQTAAQAASQPWLQARQALASAAGGRAALARAESTDGGDQDLPRLNRPGEPQVAPDTPAADAALTANAALLGNGTRPSPAPAEAVAAGADADRALATGLGPTALAPQTAAASLAQALPRHTLLASRDSGEQWASDAGLAGIDGDDGAAGEHAAAGGLPLSGHAAAAAGHRPDAALAALRAQAEQMALSARTSARDAGQDDPSDQLHQAPGLQPAAIDSAPHGTDANTLAGAGALAATAAAVGPASAGPLAPADGAAAPAQAQAQIPVPLDSPLFAPALGTQISLLARDGVQTALLQLNPAEMGPISVQIVLDGQAARVDFQADLAHTRSVIEASLPALASALQDAGLTLAGGGVFQQSPGRQEGGSGQPQAAARSNEQRQGGETTAQPATPLRTAARRGLVDLVA